MKKVLVTGANGFIGTMLCKKLLNENFRVHGTVRPGKAYLLPEGVEAAHIESIDGDTDWKNTLEEINMIVHLAARVHIMNDIFADASSAYRYVNVAGTDLLSRMGAASGCRRFVFISSVKVNGEERAQPYTERDMPMPLDPYGISKWEAEQKLHKVAKETGMELVVLRPPLVYGSGVKANFLRLIKTVDRGFPLPLASVNNIRSLIYLENLVDAIITCLVHPKAAGETFLVSDNMDLSTPELIRLMVEAMGRKARLFSFPPHMLKTIGKITGRSSEIYRLMGSLCVDSSKIKMMLGWNPPYTPEEGIRKTIEWYLKSQRKTKAHNLRL
jgi:nucleoside-diphosphate-sugar epimerase